MNDQYFGSQELHGRNEVAQPSSDRGFGYVFAGFSALLAALSLYNGGTHWPYWLAAGVMFALVAFLQPGLLAPLNRLWAKLGLILFAVVSPVTLAIVYYGCITPIGWLMRLTGKDPLRLRFEPEAKSYWVSRQPPGPAPDSLMNQF
jgi:Saxitoxin biosynthesis operon protein SxtJ